MIFHKNGVGYSCKGNNREEGRGDQVHPQKTVNCAAIQFMKRWNLLTAYGYYEEIVG